MTFDQFEAKISTYKALLVTEDTIYEDEYVQNVAHELIMNAMQVVRDAMKVAYAEGHRHGSHINLPFDMAWSESDTKRSIEVGQFKD